MEVSNAVTTLLSEVDERTVAVELARLALETAREALEKARGALDETLSKGDALGLAKGRLKKLGEDRLMALIDLGALPASRGGVMKRAEPAEAPVVRRRRADKVVREMSEAEVVAGANVASSPAVAEAAGAMAEIETAAVVTLVEAAEPANTAVMVDASAIDAVTADAGETSGAATGLVDIGAIDFDAIEAADGMDAAAAAAISDLAREEDPFAEIEAELSRAERALKAA